MGSTTNSYIDDIRRIVQSVLNQLEGLKVRWLNGVEKINDAEWSAVNYGVTVCTSGTRPTAKDGRPIYETDTNKLLIYDGAAWVEVSGSGGGMANPATANLDMADYDIIGIDELKATTSQDMTFVVSTGQSIIFQAV